MTSKLRNGSWFGRRARTLAWLIPFGAAVACSAGTPPPQEPDPALGGGDANSEPDEVLPASSSDVQKGIDAIQREDFEEARRVLSAAHAADPKDPQAAFYLGVSLEALEETDAALDAYRQALAADASLVEAAVNASALLLEKKQDAAAALEVAEQGLRAAPNNAALLMNRALGLEALGRGEAALDAYEKAVAAAPENHELRYAYAELLVGANKTERAKAELEKLANVAELRGAVANLFGRAGDFKGCLRVLDAALADAPTADLYVRRGACKHGAGDDSGAKADYEKAIELDASFAPAHYYLGMHLKEAGNKKLAIASLQKAAELAPDTGLGKRARDLAAELKKGK
jgi:tetratricopeptide (TPR) repeat protein